MFFLEVSQPLELRTGDTQVVGIDKLDKLDIQDNLSCAAIGQDGLWFERMPSQLRFYCKVFENKEFNSLIP